MNRPDTSPTSQGHLNPDRSPPVHRYPAAADLAGLVRHHWVPEWALPEGRAVTARVLGYPALNVVVERDGVVVSGPSTRVTERVLRGRGWAVGALLHPAATPALGYDAAALLDSVRAWEEPALCGRVTAAMEADRPRAERHQEAVEHLERWLRLHLGPVTEQGRLANEAVALVGAGLSPGRVGELAARLHVSERTLQRAVRRCTGMSPLEVIRRRRLQEAADRLRHGGSGLAGVASEVGFADHAHMTREFRDALAETPSDFRDSG